jgi:quercetin dioxygenase-like cupin family protein
MLFSRENKMKTVQLLEDLAFNEEGEHAHAQALYADKNGRALRFTLRPGQSVKQNNATHSPIYITVLKGQGVFTGADGQEQQLGPNSLVVFDAGETHSGRALDEELVFVSILHGAPNWREHTK